jgi:hypothetical protein
VLLQRSWCSIYVNVLDTCLFCGGRCCLNNIFFQILMLFCVFHLFSPRKKVAQKSSTKIQMRRWIFQAYAQHHTLQNTACTYLQP